MTTTELHRAAIAAKDRLRLAESSVIGAARLIAEKRRAGVPLSDFILDALMHASEEQIAASDAALAASIAETTNALADIAKMDARGLELMGREN